MPGTPAVAGSTSNTTSQQVFAVNDITFHKQHGTFCTSGGDGGFTFWDGVQKTKIKRESWSRRQDLGCHFFGPSWQRRRAGCSQRSLLTTRVQPERPQQWRHGCQTTKIRNFNRLGLVQPQPRDSRLVGLKNRPMRGHLTPVQSPTTGQKATRASHQLVKMLQRSCCTLSSRTKSRRRRSAGDRKARWRNH